MKSNPAHFGSGLGNYALTHCSLTIGLALLLSLSGLSCGTKQYGNRQNQSSNSNQRVPVQLNGPYYSSGQGGDKFQAMSSQGCLTSCNHGGVARMQASIGIPLRFDMNPNTLAKPPTGINYISGVYTGVAGPSGYGAGRVNTVTTPNNKGGMFGNRDLKLIERQQSQ